MLNYENASEVPFPETDWKVVQSAVEGSGRALESLAAAYCRPVYAFFRKRGLPREAAQDLTQEFFADCILDPERRRQVLPERETLRLRFRAWVRACLRNYASDRLDREGALKRGGGRKVVPLDAEAAEFSLAAIRESDPFAAFDRQWAADLMGTVLRRLAEELRPPSRSIFEGAVAGTSDVALAGQLNMTPEAVARARNRAVSRAREILAEEVCRTVESPDQLREELSDLSRLIGLVRVE